MVDTREVWMPVPDYEGLYEVSNLGRVRRDLAAPARSLGVPGKALSPCGGIYPIVTLSKAGVVRTHRLHLLVLRAFCGPAPFYGAHGAHNDGDPQNCALANLRWATPVENQADVDRHGRRCKGEDVFGAKMTEDGVRKVRDLIAKGFRNPQIAKRFGVSVSTIHLIRHNRIWRHVA